MLIKVRRVRRDKRFGKTVVSLLSELSKSGYFDDWDLDSELNRLSETTSLHFSIIYSDHITKIR